MRTLNIFEMSVGTTVTLKTSPDANVQTYGAVLERVPGGIVTKWLRSTLEGPGGAEMLGPAQGHNVVVLPLLKKGATASMQTTISFSDGTSETETLSLTDNEPFGWRIFMR